MQSKLPSLLVVSIPKSGTVYIRETLLRGLPLKSAIISNLYFPVDQLRLDTLHEFAVGGQLAVVHIDPSPHNLQLLRRFVPRWTVHIRDPRAVVLSWTHHIEWLFADGQADNILHVEPAPPLEYHALPFSRRLTWQIEHFMPRAVSWIESWLSVIDTGRYDIRLTHYDNLRSSEDAFFQELMGFFWLDRGAYIHSPPQKNVSVHYRRGEIDEWRRVFTTEQAERANSMLSPSLRARFDWN